MSGNRRLTVWNLQSGDLERQYADVVATGRRFTIDIIVQAPKRFTSAIQGAFEAEFPAMRPASFGARFHFAQTMSDGDIQRIIGAIQRRRSHGVLTSCQTPKEPMRWPHN